MVFYDILRRSRESWINKRFEELKWAFNEDFTSVLVLVGIFLRVCLLLENNDCACSIRVVPSANMKLKLLYGREYLKFINRVELGSSFW